jgi:hypothetical protein
MKQKTIFIHVAVCVVLLTSFSLRGYSQTQSLDTGEKGFRNFTCQTILIGDDTDSITFSGNVCFEVGGIKAENIDEMIYEKRSGKVTCRSLNGAITLAEGMSIVSGSPDKDPASAVGTTFEFTIGEDQVYIR